MGHAGGSRAGLAVLLTWRCAALRATKDGVFGEPWNEALARRSSSIVSGGMKIVDLDFLAEQSVVPGTSGNETELPYMYGRLGDAMNQLLQWLLWAERNNATAIHVLDRGFKKLDGFLEIPKDLLGRRMIWVHPRPAGQLEQGDCTRHAGPGRDPFISCSSDVRSRRRVMIQYVKPLLVPAARADRRGHGDRSEELVVHVRSGDAWSKTTFKGAPLLEYNMPPCAYYDKIIETGNRGHAFQHVRVITEADHANPCVALMRERHPNRSVVVQTESREDDAAAIMNARHLVTSQSFFSWSIAPMNEQLETLFVTHIAPDEFRDGIVPCGREGDPKVVKVTVPGLEVARSPPAKKKEWMVSYPAESLSFSEC